MTQLGELTAFIVDMDKKEKCNFEPDTYNWNANLNGNSTALERSLGNKPDAAS